MSGFDRQMEERGSSWRRQSYGNSTSSSSSASSRTRPPSGGLSPRFGFSEPAFQQSQRHIIPEHPSWVTPTSPWSSPRMQSTSPGFDQPEPIAAPRPFRSPVARNNATTRFPPPNLQPIFFASDQPAILDSRLDDQSQNALIGSFNRLRVRGKFPNRPGWGTSGRPITLRANHFAITSPSGKIYDYTVQIEPKPNIRRIRKRIFQLLEETPAFAEFKEFVVHDSGGRIVSSRILPIPLTGLEILVRHFDEDDDGPQPYSVTYKVTIAFNSQLDTDVLNKYLTGDPLYRDFDINPMISALNIILSHSPSRAGIIVGRNRFFFPDPVSAKYLGSGLEALKGYYSSVRPSFRQLMVNVNSCTTAFYKPGNLCEAMMEFLQGGSGRLGPFLKGVRVSTIHLGFKKKKTIRRVGDLTARQQTFISEEYGSITVEEYFLQKYDIRLRHAIDLPVVGVGPSADKPVWLPAEVCSILPHQPYRGKLPDDATTNMINYACNLPYVNANNIVREGLHRLGLDASESSHLREFGIEIGNEMAVIPARVLNPPSIMYGRGQARVDDRASWNLREVQFIDPKPLSNWAVLVVRDGGRTDFIGPHDPNLINILNAFTNVCNKSGMTVLTDPAVATVTLPPRDLIVDPTRSAAIESIEAALRSIRHKPTIVLVMLSNGDKLIYTGLKSLCDRTLDLHTICCHSSKIRKEKGQLQFFANLALKFNMKLGGVNHTLDHDSLRWLLDEPTIMFGSDVTHPSAGSLKGSPSIAAVVSSIDDKFIHYPASLRLQESRKEMITQLADMVTERLQQYRETSRRLPQRIVFFRDGVSEGQFWTVVQEELPQIREACARMLPGGNYRPKITLCIAGKRHHTRFYPVDADGSDKNGNPKAGTVVDRGVTSIYDFDFFLQAHGGLQGTTRPTHYYVLHDDNNFSADVLQRLTNATSYMFGRATRAVSLIPPAYYADLACERGRCYIHNLLTGAESGDTDTSISEQKVFDDAVKLWGKGVGVTLRKTMFYL